MKKRILAAVMALVLAVTMYSGIRLSSVNANADENDKDITLSVTTDKTDVRPGDEVTVTVNIEKFTPTTNNSDNPFISMWQVFVPVDTSVFEFIEFDEDTTALIDDGLNFDSKTNIAKAAMSYTVNKKNRPNIYYLDIDKNGENSTSVVYKFKLRVKSDISDNKSVSFDLSDSSIFKQFNTPDKFTYTTIPTTVNVIAKELSSIEVSKNPDKINYFTGSNDIDVTGGKVKLMYSNGTSEEIDMTSDMCSKVDLSSAGTKTVTVTYQGKTTTFEVVVADKKAVSMTLNGVDGKSIIEGTKLDVVGMSADITYDDGSVENVALTDDMVSYDNSKVGQSTATVKVAGLTKTFTFDVVAKTLEKIEVTTQPDKIRFFLNKTVDFSGAKITASYNNGTTEVVDVTSDMCSSVDTSTLGEKTVTVTYQGKTATFKVYVVDKTAQSLELNGVTGKSVTEGMKLDVTGMTAVIRYDDGSSKTVDITEDMLTYSTDKTGQATVRVSVEGLTKEFTINVVAKKAVSVKLSGTDNKSVVEGMKLDLTGINAEVTYDNGTKEAVKVTEDMVTYNTDKVGSSEAAVKIGDITEKFAFTVVAKTLTEIKVVNAPSKGTYLEGQKFDSTGLSVQAVYNNGTTEDITEAIKHSDIDTAKAGTKTVTVTYKGKTATFTVEVKTRDAVDAFNKSVTDLLNKDITKDDIETVKKLRADYEAMSDAEKEECDIKGLTKLEESVNKILEEENKATEDSKDETGNTTTLSSNSESTSGVKTGDAVNMYVYIMIALLAVLTTACTVPYVRKNRK